MKAPAGLKLKERKVWEQMFTNLQTDCPLSIDAAVRYCHWRVEYDGLRKALAKQEATAAVDKQTDDNGKRFKNTNGVMGQPPEWKSLKDAEANMQSLFKVLAPLIQPQAQTNKGLRGFLNS